MPLLIAGSREGKYSIARAHLTVIWTPASGLLRVVCSGALASHLYSFWIFSTKLRIANSTSSAYEKNEMESPMKRRILLVDDELAILLTLKAVLEIQGFDVTTASSAREAKMKLRQHQFHMVITDNRMESENA